ncbi:MAG: hypothetical protein C0511_15365 [Hyphomicrobium sp.]|nr:hypothetical protein [Hyphomicrobium sp.]
MTSVTEVDTYPSCAGSENSDTLYGSVENSTGPVGPGKLTRKYTTVLFAYASDMITYAGSAGSYATENDALLVLLPVSLLTFSSADGISNTLRESGKLGVSNFGTTGTYVPASVAEIEYVLSFLLIGGTFSTP